MKELIRFETEDQFEKFCKLLERKDDQIGQGFRPHKLLSENGVPPAKGSGVGFGETLSNGFDDFSKYDREQSRLLLEYVPEARKRFSKLSTKYCVVLDKAEGVWRDLADLTRA
jgi:hypothetical protein